MLTFEGVQHFDTCAILVFDIVTFRHYYVSTFFLSTKVGRTQFDVQEANNTRFVTMLRWVVESTNARIKRFKWFNQVIPNSSLPFIQDLICILAALLNFFHVPMINPSPYDDETIRHMHSLRKESNDLQTYLNNNDLTRNSIWNVSDINLLIQTFPQLSLSDLRTLALGMSR